MTNRCYLTTTNINDIHPSSFEEGFEPRKQLLATDEEAVPLLWLAMFRSEDIAEKVITGDDNEDFCYGSPLCTVEKALRQLDDALPKLQAILGAHNDIAGYVALFREAIANAGHTYVTIEYDEIENLYPDDRTTDMIELALLGWDQPDGIHYKVEPQSWSRPSLENIQQAIAEGKIQMPDFAAAIQGDGDKDSDEFALDFSEVEGEEVRMDGFELNSHGEVLMELTQIKLDEGAKLPPARMYLDELDYSERDQWNFTRMLGCGVHGSMGYGREVPWEKEDADFGYEIEMITGRGDDE